MSLSENNYSHLFFVDVLPPPPSARLVTNSTLRANGNIPGLEVGRESSCPQKSKATRSFTMRLASSMPETPTVLITHQPNHFLVISNQMLQNQTGEAQYPCVGG